MRTKELRNMKRIMLCARPYLSSSVCPDDILVSIKAVLIEKKNGQFDDAFGTLFIEIKGNENS